MNRNLHEHIRFANSLWEAKRKKKAHKIWFLMGILGIIFAISKMI